MIHLSKVLFIGLVLATGFWPSVSYAEEKPAAGIYKFVQTASFFGCTKPPCHNPESKRFAPGDTVKIDDFVELPLEQQALRGKYAGKIFLFNQIFLVALSELLPAGHQVSVPVVMTENESTEREKRLAARFPPMDKPRPVPKPFVQPDENYYKDGSAIYFEFRPASKVTQENFFEHYADVFKLRSEDHFIKNEKNFRGRVEGVYSYDQYYKNIRVDGGQMLLHEKAGKLTGANGYSYSGLSVDTLPVISKDQALQAAMRSLSVEKYLWQDEEQCEYTNSRNNERDFCKPPDPELILWSQDTHAVPPDFHLAWHFSLDAANIGGSWDFYIDAHTGEILNSRSNFMD